jgi:hypothetical protein
VKENMYQFDIDKVNARLGDSHSKWSGFKQDFQNGKIVTIVEVDDMRNKTKGGTEYTSGNKWSHAFDSDAVKLGALPDPDFKRHALRLKVSGSFVNVLRIGRRPGR